MIKALIRKVLPLSSDLPVVYVPVKEKPPTTCTTCRFSVRVSHGPLSCRRFPPSATFYIDQWLNWPGPVPTPHWESPRVSDNDWCGEWKEKE